jgi:hypothetical protein
VVVAQKASAEDESVRCRLAVQGMELAGVADFMLELPRKASCDSSSPGVLHLQPMGCKTVA